MVAFDEQHLRDGRARFIQRGRIVADLLSGHGGHSAGRCILAGDIDHTKLAAAMWREPLPVTQMRNVHTGCQCRIHDGLPSQKRDFLPVYRDGILFCVRAHVVTFIQCELPYHHDG